MIESRVILGQSELFSVPRIDTVPPPNLLQPGRGFQQAVRLNAAGIGLFSIRWRHCSIPRLMLTRMPPKNEAHARIHMGATFTITQLSDCLHGCHVHNYTIVAM